MYLKIPIGITEINIKHVHENSKKHLSLFSRSYLQLTQLLPALCLFGVVEPLDLDVHLSSPRLPHCLDPPDVRQVGSSSRQENSTVTHLHASGRNVIALRSQSRMSLCEVLLFRFIFHLHTLAVK